jgi:SAM-dependent methyltransferase
MLTLKKNVGAFNSDVRDNQGYRYTTSASYSSFVANRRMTDATLQHIAPMAKRVLDAGCGDGTYTNYIKGERSSLEIVGFDPASEAIRVAHGRYPDIEFVVGDVLRPETFPEGKFDLIILRGVLHHVLDPAEAIRQCAVRADLLLIIEPNGNNPILKLIEKLSPYHRQHEERSFSSQTLARWCREARCPATSISFIGFVPFFFPTLPAKIIHFFQPFLERMPLLCRFFGAQVIIAARSHCCSATWSEADRDAIQQDSC